MNITKVTGVYFSPTNTNMRSVISIASPLAKGERIEAIDTTPTYRANVHREFGPDEVVVFGAPVYGGRIYEGAIDMDCVTVKDNCISCFRCIRECPMNAKHMNVPAYNEFAENFSKRLAEARPNEYFI